MGELAFAWVDLETTGLSATGDVPLEIGFRLTDQWGFGEEFISCLIWEDDCYETYWRGMNDFVRNMHTENGLVDAYYKNPAATRAEADDVISEWLIGADAEGLPLAGNSIGSLDRPFLLHHFPKINEVLSYRNVDMSSLKEIVRVTNPTLFAELKPIIGTKENADHRVMGDIEASITEYRAYLDKFLRVDMEA